MAILTGKAQFLVKYGELSKIMKNFTHDYGDGNIKSVFHVFFNNEEVSVDEVVEYETSESHAISVPEIEVKLDLGDFTLLLCPRGMSKTTIAGFAIPLYKIVYREDKFSLYVSKAQTHTEAQLESIRKELSKNEALIEFFGNLKPERSADERWAKEKFETSTGIALQARGKGSAIRGIHHDNRRPTTIIVDDPQSKADVKSDTIREDDKRWALAELFPARARITGTKGRIIVLGTWLHQECLVAVFSRDPRFTVVKLEVLDVDGNFIWPDYMDQKGYDAERSSFALAGLLADFYREYHNREVDEDELPFPSKFVIYEAPDPEDELVCATYLDPASSQKRSADFKAVTTVGIRARDGMMFLLESWVERAEDEVCLDEYFRQSVKWKSNFHGVESNGGQAAWGTLIRQHMFRVGHYFELEMVHHKNRKVDRIRAALRPRYAAGFFRHRVVFPEHEEQLFNFRYDDSHMHDDGPDSQAACVVLLDPTAAFNAPGNPAEDQFTDNPGDEEYNKELALDLENAQWAS